MPFDPRHRLSHPADELPADLAELAVQLSADAQRLAERYPAPTPRAARRAWWRWRRPGAAAAAVIAVALGALAARQFPSSGEPTATHSAPRVVVGPLGAPLVQPAAVRPSTRLWFEELSTPEREGVLDLLEDESVGLVSVSL